MSTADISLAILNSRGGVAAAINETRPRESSSTIKVPIIQLALETMLDRGDTLSKELRRLPHHTSRGSGILNWTDAKSVSLHNLISTLLVYSDCLATNMLLDYIGGQQSLNAWLGKQGLMTRLHMRYLDFSDGETKMPSVGTTTALELAQLFKQLETAVWSNDVKKLLYHASSHINQSWLELNLNSPLSDLRHKTGSMINEGSDGETVLNAAGGFSLNGTRYYFGLLSHGHVETDDIHGSKLKKTVACEFEKQLSYLVAT